jgi:acetoin utilization protein AcuB
MIFLIGESRGTLLRAAGAPFSAVLPARFAKGDTLARARVVCPRHGELDGATCVDCPHLIAVAADGVRCRSSGADPVVDWMTPAMSVAVTSAASSCARAQRTASVAGVHHLLVLDDARMLVGVVCGCDLGRAGAASVGDAMSADIFATGPATSLSEARAAMDQLGIGCLPVIAGGLVRGLITRADLARAGARLAQ